jgi:hypothetical protein
MLAILVGTLVVPTTAASAARPCPTGWGSRGETAADTSGAPITDVRVGRHRCFDRLVIEVDGDAAGYRVRYVRRIVQDGSGLPVAVAGGARLRVIALAPAYDDLGDPTIDLSALDDLTFARFRTFRDLASAGSFEGQTTLGLGVRARLPFRVFTVDGPGDRSRIVVDVAHRW